MKRILTALVAAAPLAGAAVASSAPAEARWGWGWGLGGFAAGAVIGSALASSYYYPYGYYAASGRRFRQETPQLFSSA